LKADFSVIDPYQQDTLTRKKQSYRQSKARWKTL